MGDIVKVAILPLMDGKLFMCRKRGRDFLVNLGGRLEPGESDIECAVREAEEEARCKVINLKYYMTTRAPLPEQDGPGEIELRCYLGDLVGIPRINSQDSIYEHL